MDTYTFTLVIGVPSDKLFGWAQDVLFEAGCNDALLSKDYMGTVQLDFDREAHSEAEAIELARKQVESAGIKVICVFTSAELDELG